MRDRIRRYPFGALIRPYRRQYALGMLTLLVVDLINVALPLLTKTAVDAIPRRDTRVLWAAGLGYGLLMLVQSAGRYLWRIFLIGTSHRIAKDLRVRLYDHLQRLPLSHYQSVRTGDLMSRATNDIESVRMGVGPGILVTADAVLVFAMIVPVMLYFSVKLSLLAFAFYPIVPWLTAKLGDRIDTLFESLQTRMSRLSGHAQESFAAVRLIKSLVLESHVSRRFRDLSRDYRAEGLQLARYEAAFSPALGLLTNLGTFLILLLGGLDVIGGALTVGTFIAFQRFVVQLSWPMEAIGWAVTMNREGTSAYRRVLDVLNTPTVESVREGVAHRIETPPLLALRGLVHAVGRGEGGEAYGAVARGFSLRIPRLDLPRGRRVGVVGPVGSGKSTLFGLILRLSEPPAGTVFLDGRDVATVPLLELRTRVASVEQQILLFSESVRANILMGTGGETVDGAVEQAAETAAILDEIRELDRGMETPLGERGVNLSGGQKQRLALARALAREPELLLLDDAFSAVDVAIEEEIIGKLLRSNPGLTLLFSSHRLSIMPRMDEIWLMDSGELVDRAPHAELLARQPLYRALWERSARQTEAERLGGQVGESRTEGAPA